MIPLRSTECANSARLRSRRAIRHRPMSQVMPGSKTRMTVFLIAVGVNLGTNGAFAAVSFTDNFDGPAFNPALEDRDGTYVFSGGSTHNAGNRSYVRTVDGDFLTVDFVAEVTFTMDGGGGPGGVFVGLGPADKDPTFFNEPLSSVYMLDHSEDFFITTITVVRSNATADGTVLDHFNWPSPLDGTHRVRITKAGDALTFAVDLFFVGSFAPEFSGTLSLATDLPFLTASNSHLFFGSEATSSLFLDMSVSVDCNSNGIPDACDIMLPGGSQDDNGNGIPDECDMRGDFDGDGMVTEDDIGGFADCLLLDCGTLLGDFSGDGVFNGLDIGNFVECLLGGLCP